MTGGSGKVQVVCWTTRARQRPIPIVYQVYIVSCENVTHPAHPLTHRGIIDDNILSENNIMTSDYIRWTPSFFARCTNTAFPVHYLCHFLFILPKIFSAKSCYHVGPGHPITYFPPNLKKSEPASMHWAGWSWTIQEKLNALVVRFKVLFNSAHQFHRKQ